MRGSSVQVIRLIPPAVETDLHRSQARRPPGAMTPDVFVAAMMAGLDRRQYDIAVGLARVRRHRVPSLVLGVVHKPQPSS